MSEKQLNPCPNVPLFDPPLNLDVPNGFCCPGDPSLEDVSFFQDVARGDDGLGRSANSDPMMAGRIKDSKSGEPNRNTIYRNGRSLRGTNLAVMDLFKDIVVTDLSGREFPVSLMWGSHERAVEAIIGPNARQDGSGVFDRVTLPLMSLYRTDYTYNLERYMYHGAVNWLRGEDGRPGWSQRSERHDSGSVLGVARGIPIDVGYNLFVWSLFESDMDEIFEQVVSKFSPVAYIRVQGVLWEAVVKLESIGKLTEAEPGEHSPKIEKLQFTLKAETFIPQPIRRESSVLSIKQDFLDGVDPAEVSEVLGRSETDVHGFNP